MHVLRIAVLPIILFGFLFFGVPHQVHAGNIDNTEIGRQMSAFGGQQGANLGAPKDPRTVAARVINGFLGLLATALIVYVVYGGTLILISRGEEDKVKEGRSVIMNAIVGLFIILAAYGITRMVTYILQGQAAPQGFDCTILNNPDIDPGVLGGNIDIQQMKDICDAF